jgi:hypothetical protein
MKKIITLLGLFALALVAPAFAAQDTPSPAPLPFVLTASSPACPAATVSSVPSAPDAVDADLPAWLTADPLHWAEVKAAGCATYCRTNCDGCCAILSPNVCACC